MIRRTGGEQKSVGHRDPVTISRKTSEQRPAEKSMRALTTRDARDL